MAIIRFTKFDSWLASNLLIIIIYDAWIELFNSTWIHFKCLERFKLNHTRCVWLVSSLCLFISYLKFCRNGNHVTTFERPNRGKHVIRFNASNFKSSIKPILMVKMMDTWGYMKLDMNKVRDTHCSIFCQTFQSTDKQAVGGINLKLNLLIDQKIERNYIVQSITSNILLL